MSKRQHWTSHGGNKQSQVFETMESQEIYRLLQQMKSNFLLPSVGNEILVRST